MPATATGRIQPVHTLDNADNAADMPLEADIRLPPVVPASERLNMFFRENNHERINRVLERMHLGKKRILKILDKKYG